MTRRQSLLYYGAEGSVHHALKRAPAIGLEHAAWRRDPELPYQSLGENVVVIDPQRRDIHLLNEVAARVWTLLEAPRSLEDLVAAVGEEYDGAASDLRSGIEAVLAELDGKGILLRS